MNGHQFIALLVLADTAGGGAERVRVLGAYPSQPDAVKVIEATVVKHLEGAWTDIKDVRYASVTELDKSGQPVAIKPVDVAITPRVVAG